jgi:ABC transport system ATP-binding/permease protein
MASTISRGAARAVILKTRHRKGFSSYLPPILNAQGLSKTFGAVPLFERIAFTIAERDRIGLIGPNGSGKSTLLRILSGELASDTGEVALRKRTRLSYVQQDSQFLPAKSVREIIVAALQTASVAEADWDRRTAETLGRSGFDTFEQTAANLSGGWRKRLAIAEALVQQPDILLLDEPTNHLDLDGIEWLEELLQEAPFASVIVSHDRYFLENVATEVFELDRVYPDGYLRTKGSYSQFLENKEELLHAQAKRQEALENLVKNEIAWLRRGAKARTCKSKARIGNAHRLIDELATLNTRTRSSSAEIDFAATARQTKRLVELVQLSYTISDRTLFSGLDFTITAGMRVGLVGPNGSGKSTLLRLLQEELKPTSGMLSRAESLQIVYFDQNRELDLSVTLRRALAPESDSVFYQDRVIHVASLAARFLFSGEQLNQPVSSLSGGERARVLIARLMLQPADVLLLDEPTNDLDIPTLEILEESLLEYRGALVLVTHDRYMLDRVSSVVIGLDGLGHAGRFADYRQWEIWQAEQVEQSKGATTPIKGQNLPPAFRPKKKLSYLEAREYATIEQRVVEAEEVLRAAQLAMEDPAIVTDAARILATQAEYDAAKKLVDDLYARWAELEAKIS